MRYADYLVHYNHNHDKLGRFARSVKIRKEFSKKHPLDIKENRNERKEYSKSGIKRGLFKDTIREGSSVYRYSSTSKETIDGRRKYASLTKTDRKVYKKDALNNVLSNKGNEVYLYQLQTTKKLKVAKGEKVTKDLIKRYGDKEVRQAYKDISKVNLRTNYHKLQKELRDPKNENHWMYDDLTKKSERVSKFVHKKLYDEKVSNEVYERYRNKGYDAIVDPEDYLDGYYYPVVLLNPDGTVRKKKVRKIR